MSLWLMAIATSDVLTVLRFKELATRKARTVISLTKTTSDSRRESKDRTSARI
jgi:hypothetical protein